MKIGIDSYCFHRQFGEVYPNQRKPDKKISCEDFLHFAGELKVQGVSLETCFFRKTSAAYMAGLKEILLQYKLEPVVAWGHPDGLEGGKNPGQVEDLKKYLPVCGMLGAKVLRVVGSSLAFRNDPHGPQIKNLVKLFKEPAKAAAGAGIKLAIENHFDFTTDEIGEIVSGVGSPSFGITFDTGNALRIGNDPVAFARKLGPYIFATHTKDVAPLYGGNPEDWYYFACVPVGKGVIDMPAVAGALIDGGYDGLFAIEIDYLHPDYDDEFKAVKQSVGHLRKIRKLRTAK